MLHRVLFSGGLDSTYRLCQLALDADAVVEPVYIMFPPDSKYHHIRPELQREMQSQDKILNYIQLHPATKAAFRSIHRIHCDDIPSDIRYRSLDKWLANCSLGWQYIYIALYAKWHPCVELCHELYSGLFRQYNVQFYVDEHGHTRMNTQGLPNILSLTFANVSFPLIGKTRASMIHDLRSWGYFDVLNMIWFCYSSIAGKPCGLCDNCYSKLEQGLIFLFDKSALKRYYIRKVLETFPDNRLKMVYLSWAFDGFQSSLFKVYHNLFPQVDIFSKPVLADLNTLQKLMDSTVSQLKAMLSKHKSS